MRACGIILFFLCSLGLALPLPAPAAEQSAEPRLLKTVALVRHGVRAPTQDAETLALWTTRPWPHWPVERGQLSPRGARLVRAMWNDLRGIYRNLGILPDAACPPQGAVVVRADTSQRTQATARALLEGLAPGCEQDYLTADARPDPLFHPARAGICAFDPAATASDILKSTEGGIERLQDEYGPALALVDQLTAPPAPELCMRFNQAPQCRIADISNFVSVSAEGRGVRLSGGLEIASELAEIFMLEYDQWPGTAVAWGQVDGRALRQMLPLHSAVTNMVHRAPLVARSQGSALLTEIATTLAGTHYDQRLNAARLVVFVGHEANIAHLGALLEAQWQAEGYPIESVPPGSGLFLELWEQNGQAEVRVRFFAQPLEALHIPFDEEPVAGPTHYLIPQDTPATPPAKDAVRRGKSLARPHAPTAAVVSIPPVVGEARLALGDFTRLVQKKINVECLAPQQFARPQSPGSAPNPVDPVPGAGPDTEPGATSND